MWHFHVIVVWQCEMTRLQNFLARPQAIAKDDDGPRLLSISLLRQQENLFVVWCVIIPTSHGIKSEVCSAIVFLAFVESGILAFEPCSRSLSLVFCRRPKANINALLSQHQSPATTTTATTSHSSNTVGCLEYRIYNTIYFRFFFFYFCFCLLAVPNFYIILICLWRLLLLLLLLTLWVVPVYTRKFTFLSISLYSRCIKCQIAIFLWWRP